jgi:hypothetical protein
MGAYKYGGLISLRGAFAGAIGISVALAQLPLAGRINTSPSGAVLTDEAVYFAFDDVSIPSTENLVLAMHPPVKHPDNPVVPLGKRGDPDEWKVEYCGTVIRQGGKFKMWYIAVSREGYVHPSAGRDIDFRGWRIAYAESEDGVHWIKPELGLATFRGSRKNNLVSLPEGFGGYDAAVLYEPEEKDASRRFKMLALLTRFGAYRLSTGKSAYVPLYSGDGLRWRVAEEVLTSDRKTIAAENLVRMEGTGIYKWNGVYHLSGQGALRSPVELYGRYAQVYRSPDLITWSKMPIISFARREQYHKPAHPDPQGEGDDIEQTHLGVTAWNRGNVLLGLTGMWHGTGDWRTVTHDLGFLISNDGIRFREPVPDYLFARVGQDGKDWDVGGLSQGQSFANVRDKTYIWYGQMDQRQGTYTGKPWKAEGGVGLLVLDRDRFGSLSVRDPDKPAGLISSELQVKGPAKVWVNADGLGPESSLKVELLDQAEQPLPEYSGESAAHVSQSGLRAPVLWKTGDAIAEIKHGFKIKVTWEGDQTGAIEFYALYVEAGR